MRQKRLRTIAAPSFVWPADIAENCNRLASMVSEVGLLFFETDSCLAYTEKDLPLLLARLGLRFHVHLPLNLPWEESPEAVLEVAIALLSKCAFLKPWAVVLHPPPIRVCPEPQNRITTPHACEKLRLFIALWNEARPATKLLLENIRDNDLVAAWPLIRYFGVGICLDLGHLLAFSQKTDKIPGIWPHVGMLHLSAPGPAGEHRSLRLLDQTGRKRLEGLLAQANQDCVLMLEVFSPNAFLESLTVLHDWEMACV
ncbi:MAG TPA: hypothetical protein ENN39_00415 [Desulfonatronum sp.]|nr:hypothetical protein [Desulfonatronum sp.]